MPPPIANPSTAATQGLGPMASLRNGPSSRLIRKPAQEMRPALSALRLIPALKIRRPR